MNNIQLGEHAAYDRTRATVGIEFIAQLIKPEHRVLDIKCRTGNYILQLAPIVDEIVGIDTDDSMVSLARMKLQNHGNVRIIQPQNYILGTAQFEDESFDVILVNQFLEDLETTDFDNFPNTFRFCQELSRILKPGGVVCFNTCLPEQIDGFWYIDFIPRIKEEYKRRYMPLQRLAQYLGNVGFHNQFRAMPCQEPLQGIHYFNLLGLLDYIWRAGDPKLKSLTEEEMGQIQNNLINMIKEGKLGAYFDEKDKFRKEKGQTIFIIGQKMGIAVDPSAVNSKNIKVI